jgi:hypothetical protein
VTEGIERFVPEESEASHDEQAAIARANEAERRVAVLETENRLITEQVRALGARLVAGEQVNADVLSIRAELARRNAELTACRAELARRDVELSASRAEADDLRRQLAVVVTSRSWRITRPARRVFDALRHLLGRSRS